MSSLKRYFGFTLIELLVVIAIIGLLATICIFNLNAAKERAKISHSIADQRQLILGLQLYYNDMGFYPPDVTRGWDPGLSHSLPYNPDTGETSIPSCSHCPSDWVDQVSSKWRGPYVKDYPNTTAWGGKYDYNYWSNNEVRYGCTVPAGIYLGVERDYDDNNNISESAETTMVEKKYDFDNCINGESQMLLYKF